MLFHSPNRNLDLGLRHIPNLLDKGMQKHKCASCLQEIENPYLTLRPDSQFANALGQRRHPGTTEGCPVGTQHVDSNQHIDLFVKAQMIDEFLDWRASTCPSKVNDAPISYEEVTIFILCSQAY